MTTTTLTSTPSTTGESPHVVGAAVPLLATRPLAVLVLDNSVQAPTGIAFGLLHLTQEAVDQLLARRRTLRRLRGEDPALDELVYAETAVQYYGGHPGDFLTEEQEESYNDLGWLVLPSAPDPALTGEAAAGFPSSVLVEDGGVRWATYARQSEERQETRMVPFEVLERLLTP